MIKNKMRKCGNCNVEKELNEDNFRHLYLDKLTKWCLICLDEETEKIRQMKEEKNNKMKEEKNNKNKIGCILL